MPRNMLRTSGASHLWAEQVAQLARQVGDRICQRVWLPALLLDSVFGDDRPSNEGRAERPKRLRRKAVELGVDHRQADGIGVGTGDQVG